MFEYHGWVTIRETAGLDDDPSRLRSQVGEINEVLAGLGEYGLLDLRWMNGTPFLHIAGMPNHRGVWGEQVIGLFRRVGRIAPGSYGLLHIWDDEDAEEGKTFRIFRLARGVVTEHADSLLSPLIPTVEDGGPAE
ncbi:Imm7 family immunity protein [Actinomadura sp. DC4]|uniref:Imm7 family immunity protein n=1 Tax=Actinomadura sp. DC4 TaxID=3055069 RepID=UPI0025B07C20|nr:Imm7 family immunity protein [Actinomadura sp. DC4]MDN3354021.1 Imm7 family immunity protein [Actinomadura sp. DC4]